MNIEEKYKSQVYNRRYYQKNKEKIAARAKKYREENKKKNC